MAAKNIKTTELTDIPLSQEAGDGATSSTSDKGKLNSLKRFLCLSSVKMPASKHFETHSDSKMKGSRSLNLRFRSFHKRDATDDEPRSEKPKSTWKRIFKKPNETTSTNEIQAAPTDPDNGDIKQNASG